MKKSELIKVLQDSIEQHGDGPVFHDLDAGANIIEITQASSWDAVTIEEVGVKIPVNSMVLL